MDTLANKSSDFIDIRKAVEEAPQQLNELDETKQSGHNEFYSHLNSVKSNKVL